MNTNIRTVSVHDTLFGRVANNLEVAQLSRAVEPWFADFHDTRVKQAIADLDEPTLRGAAAETSVACRPLFVCENCAYQSLFQRRTGTCLPVG